MMTAPGLGACVRKHLGVVRSGFDERSVANDVGTLEKRFMAASIAS